MLNYYRRFIYDFSHIARPLHDLTKQDVPWTWGQPQQEAFEKLKTAMLTAPVLVHPDHERQYLLETDASDVAIGAVLSQKQDDGKYHPVDFLSSSHTKEQRAYPTHDQELLAIMKALDHWRHWLMGAKHTVEVLSDNEGLQWFRTKQKLNGRQKRWMVELEDYHVKIYHRPGRQSVVPDALSRRPDHGTLLEKAALGHGVVLPNHYFADSPLCLDSSHKSQRVNAVQHESFTNKDHLAPFPKDSLEMGIYKAQARDPLILKFNMTTEGDETTIPKHWKLDNSLWTYWNKIYIPETYRQMVFREHHSAPTAAHPGRDATLYSIRQHYYWPNLKNDVIEWIRNCDICQRTKVITKKPHGQLKPIDVAPRPWGVVTSDLITGLPPCKGYTAIWGATDKRGKMVHIAPTTDELDSEGSERLFMDKVWKLHGTPDKMITDRGPQFSSRFVKSLNENLQIETALSTAYHPQTDGQSERTNQNIEQALRTVVSWHQDDWVDWLPIIEFALNNRYHSALKTTPFYANYGFHPHIGSLPRIDTPIESVENFVRHIQEVQKDTKKALEQAAEDMKRFYDRHRGQTPEYNVGQKVLLDNADLRLNRPSRKLSERRSGPFKILERIGTHAYRLELPAQWKNVHPVFHVTKLELYREDPENPNFPQPLPDVIEGEPEWEVEKVLDAKLDRKTLYFLVKWKGWEDHENSWEPEINLVHSQDIINDFYREHPGAPRRLPSGEVSGQPITKKGARRRFKSKKTRVNNMDQMEFTPLRQQTNVENWPNGRMI
jgi:hypothetical protein